MLFKRLSQYLIDLIDMKNPSKRKGYVKYSSKLVEVAVEAAKTGCSDSELAKVCGCTEATLYRWLRTKTDFADAIAEARKPSTQLDDLARYKKRKEAVEKWMDDYVINQGEVIETLTGDGKGSYVKSRKGGMPDLRLIDRILGVNPEPEEFKLIIDIAEPEIED